MVVYFGIIATTGYAFGLIAALIGVVVGKAVKWGSYGRGGWKYQMLAVLLTYLSIGMSYVPMVLVQMAKHDQSANTTKSAAVPEGASATQPTARSTAASASSVSPAAVTLPAWFRIPFAVVILFAFAMIAPFAGFSVFRLVIIGIGVYEAWKINRRRTFVITGPHAITNPPSVAAVT